MSRIPTLSHADRDLAERWGGASKPRSDARFSRHLEDYIPLSERPSRELRARSAELAAMAETARTAEAKIALEVLASRFAVMAARRKAAESLDPTSFGTDDA